MLYIFIKKVQDWKILSLYNNTTSAWTSEAVAVIWKYCLLIFKACRLGHPHFEIKFIDFFSPNLIKTAFIAQNVFDNYLYIAWKHIS